jgi:hypothetical protein
MLERLRYRLYHFEILEFRHRNLGLKVEGLDSIGAVEFQLLPSIHT